MTGLLPALVQGEVIQNLPPWVTMDPRAFTLTATALFASIALVMYPLVRALARRIEGRRAALDPALAEEMRELQARVRDVEDLRARLAELEEERVAVHELEERLEFTERLLARHRDETKLPPGGAP
jgi:hypothetical protein